MSSESQSERLTRIWEENNDRRRAELALEEEVLNLSFGSLAGEEFQPDMFDDALPSEIEPIQLNSRNDEFMMRASSVADIGRRHLQGFGGFPSSHRTSNRGNDLFPKAFSVSEIGRRQEQQTGGINSTFQPSFQPKKNTNIFFRTGSVHEMGGRNQLPGGRVRRSISTLKRPVGLSSSISGQANATFSFSSSSQITQRLAVGKGVRPAGALKAPRLSFRTQPQSNAETDRDIRSVFINRPAASFAPVQEDTPANSAKMTIASMDSDSLLHNSCKLYPETFSIVESALQLDPGAIRRPIPMVCKPLPKGGDAIDPDSTHGSGKSQRYCYPINIALKYRASLEVVKLLVSSGPDVLMLKDGPSEASSLSIALSLNASADVVDAIMSSNKLSAAIPDRHTNFPLHTAIRSQHVTLDMVARIHDAYPKALTTRNFHRETPVDIAIRTPRCPEEILDYLQRLAFGQMEAEAIHLHDSAGSDMAL